MLNEFSWKTEESGSYAGNESLDCQIGITTEGQYEIRNHADPSQSQRFDTPEELANALASVLAEKKERVS